MGEDGKMSPEERERLRRERQQAAEAEMAEMDTIYEGGFGDEGPIRPTEEAIQDELVVEEQIVEEPIQIESRVEEVVETPIEEPVPEDEYDFSFINDLARDAIMRQAVTQQQPVEQTVQTQPIAQIPPVPPVQLDGLVTLEEMTSAFESPEKFLEVLNKVATTVYQRATLDAQEQALLRLPQVARNVSMQVIDQAALVQKFYKENAELVPYKDFVRYCAMQVEAKHPDWSYEAVAEETAKIAKHRLPLLRKAQKESKQRPALPGSGRVAQRRGSPAQGLTALERELADMPDNF